MTESAVALYLDRSGGGLDGPEAFVVKKFPLTTSFLLFGVPLLGWCSQPWP